MRAESLRFLTDLLNTPTPSSEEAKGQRVWLDYLAPYAEKLETDGYLRSLLVTR